MRRVALGLGLLALAGAWPALSRDTLGVFGQWAAFRDGENERCYAIAEPVSGDRQGAFLSVGYWPQGRISGQVQVRFASAPNPEAPAALAVGQTRVALVIRGRDGWARTAADDRRLIAAMREGRGIGASARGAAGRRITLGFSLNGAATAIDAAALGCAAGR